MKTTKKRVGR